MPIGSPEVLERILDLFPAETLQEFERVTTKMTKAEAIPTVSEGYEEDRVLGFIANNFGRLHQHVYVFRGTRQPKVAAPFGERFGVRRVGEEKHSHYLADLTHELVIEPPLERIRIDLAWPLKVVESPTHVRLHLAIMSRGPASIERGKMLVSWKQHPSETELVEAFRLSRGREGGVALDLNRGIKALWHADEFDAPSVQFKESRSTTKHVMDEEYTLKADHPEVYGGLRLKPLLATQFRYMQDDACIPYFQVQPTEGWFRFRRFSSSNDCIDRVIRSVLESN
jgi:hypothetical protein